ncbi:MAG: amidohydrolase [Anaerolineae bacterium]|nr:MAG: amidohydrolase [Anaerolineae bacterium]
MLLLRNATIYTLNPDEPQVGALVIEPHSGRILAAGDADTLALDFPRARVQDLGGQVVLPGLTDSHLHLQYYALGLQKLDLFGLSRAGCIEKVVERAHITPPGVWILGHGWNQNHWPEGFPSAADLDAVAPDHPVYLTATSLHAGWCNTAALRAAGVTAATPDPINGTFGRDPSGAPDGMLYEAAMSIISDAIPRTTDEENAAAIRSAQETLFVMGLTGVHDFDRIPAFRALQTLHGRGELKVRVTKNLPVEHLETIIAAGLQSGFGDDRLRIGNIKVFADGALGPRTAAMLEPYEGEPENTGMLFVDREQLFEYGRQAAEGGLGLTVHAIGDRANHETLAGYALLRQFETERGLPRRRHRLEHAQIVHPDDFVRFNELDIMASVQPIHATSDMEMADTYWGERAVHSYAWRTLLASGARLAFGSDAPVDTPNPFRGMHAAVTRQHANGTPGAEGWFPAQRLTLAEVINGYTQGAAYAAGMEDRLGRLSSGYLADLLVMDVNPFNSPSEMLRDLRPAAVMVGGEWVFEV